MIQIDLPTLVKRLNLFSRQALEMAASECMSQQAAEITVSHVLIQMLAMPRSDLRVITRQGDIGMEELRQALTVENYTTARSADSYLDMLPEGDPRDQFHRQYLAAQLTEEAGLVQLAQQQYRMLFRMGLQMMVADWEPSLLEQLEQKFTAEQ
ncbi:TPA: type VI secretion system domain-containing protein [Escherichia coli]|nr:type VI secretion system domain-containing protein [Escherichia coli]